MRTCARGNFGLFFSYVGLFSYTQFENWGYQASFTSDNTPWLFDGARIQIFPTDRLKVELGWSMVGSPETKLIFALLFRR